MLQEKSGELTNNEKIYYPFQRKKNTNYLSDVMKKGKKMIKREFVKQCAAATNLSQKQVSDVLEYLLETITKTLYTKKAVKIFGLGKLTTVQRKSKKHFNIQTGDYYPGREYTTYKFIPGIDLKKLLLI